jgi:hypothetical protein
LRTHDGHRIRIRTHFGTGLYPRPKQTDKSGEKKEEVTNVEVKKDDVNNDDTLDKDMSD